MTNFFSAPNGTKRAYKVLILIKGLGLGGAEKLLTSALPYLDREAFSYEVGYFLPWKNALVHELENGGLKVTCFNNRRDADFAIIPKIVSYIRKNSIDLLHLHLPYTGIVGRIAGKLAGVTGIVYTEHNVFERLNPFSKFFNRLTYGLNDRVIAVSEDVAKSIPWGKKDSIVEIDNGVDCAQLALLPNCSQDVRRELNIPLNDFVIGSVANLSPKKNHEMMIAAFSMFQRKAPAASLVLVGQTLGRDAVLMDLAQKLDVGDRVYITGPRTDATRILTAFDIFSLSSDFEGLPVALLEAMAIGKPAVVTAVGGVPTVVSDSNTGFVVPPGQAAIMAEKYELLYRDGSLRSAMGRNAAARVRAHYDIRSMVARVEDVYRQILSGSTHGR